MPRTRTNGKLLALPRSFYRRPAEVVAPELLGRYIVRSIDDGTRLVLRIVEAEAYLGAPDRASHGWNGRRTERNRSLYLGAGHSYVYFIYGMHYCMNVVTGGIENGDAVLIRAATPVEGAEIMAGNRKLKGAWRPGDIAGGPAKLCQALSVDRVHDGLRLDRGPLRVTRGEPVTSDQIALGPRIGIDYAGEAASWELRFAIRGCRDVSRPRL